MEGHEALSRPARAESRAPIDLPSLRELEFEVADRFRSSSGVLSVLSSISSPAVTSLSVEFDSTSRMKKDLEGVLGMFISKSAQTLKHLSLKDTSSESREQTFNSVAIHQLSTNIYRTLPMLINLETLDIGIIWSAEIIQKMTLQSSKLPIFPRLTQIRSSVFDSQLNSFMDMLRSRSQDKHVMAIKVVELMVLETYDYWEEESHTLREAEVSWLDTYSTNSVDVMAKLDAIRKSGVTVSCFSYPRFHVSDFLDECK